MANPPTTPDVFPPRRWRTFTVRTLLASALLLAIAFAVTAAVEALEERRSAVAAGELRIAALTVASADALRLHGAQMPASKLAAANATIEDDHGVALHSLSGAEADHAEQLLRDLATTGVALLAGGTASHGSHDHNEILSVLEQASGSAMADAAASERTALLAVLAALLTIGLGASSLFRARRLVASQSAAAEEEGRVGRRVQALLNDLPEILLVIDPADDVSYRSASADRLLPSDASTSEGLAARAVDGQRDLFERYLRGAGGGRSASQVFKLTDLHGVQGWFDVRVSDLSDDPLVGGRIVTIRDITSETHLLDELERQARTDVLTGLPNRRVLSTTLGNVRTALNRNDAFAAVIVVDVDDFKEINDTLGHEAGDRALRHVGSRLRSHIRDGETLLRLGGDEFAIILPRVEDRRDALTRAGLMVDVFRSPVQLGEHHSETIRASIGIAVTDDAGEVDALLGRADMAMYRAKNLGGNTVIEYEPDLDGQMSRAARIGRELQEIDPDSEFHLVFQPIVPVDGAEIVGLEALLRWTSPTLGVVGPEEFIPIAEKSEVICHIGGWVLDRVCRQIAQWTTLGLHPDIAVSLNVSPRQLTDERFVSNVLAAAERWSVDLSRLVIEVTESAALDPAGVAVTHLGQLRAAGARVSIDDFGSGYSNLGQLITMPFDSIKVDRSLMLTLAGMREASGGDPATPCGIMGGIVSIGNTLGTPIVCEGVETDLQRVQLSASGITFIQGYLTGRPLPAHEITPLVCAVDRRAAITA